MKIFLFLITHQTSAQQCYMRDAKGDVLSFLQQMRGAFYFQDSRLKEAFSSAFPSKKILTFFKSLGLFFGSPWLHFGMIQEKILEICLFRAFLINPIKLHSSAVNNIILMYRNILELIFCTSALSGYVG